MTAWPGWTKEHTLILPLDTAPPAQPLRIDGREFAPKDELHITLVGRALGRELAHALGRRLDAATRPAFEALDWTHEPSGERLLIEKPGTTDAGERGTVASVIECVELPALSFYYRWLGELLGRQLPVPPPHVTLYTFNKARGIGIPTAGRLRAWSRGPVEV